MKSGMDGTTVWLCHHKNPDDVFVIVLLLRPTEAVPNGTFIRTVGNTVPRSFPSFATHSHQYRPGIFFSRARKDHNIFQYSAGSGVNELWQRVHVYLKIHGIGPFGEEGRKHAGKGNKESPGSRDEDALGDSY